MQCVSCVSEISGKNYYVEQLGTRSCVNKILLWYLVVGFEVAGICTMIKIIKEGFDKETQIHVFFLFHFLT